MDTLTEIADRVPGTLAATAGSSPPVPLVWKFGGTSLANHDRLRAVAARMVRAQRLGRGVVAVLSAMGNATDELSAMAYQMSVRPPLRELDVLLSVGESISVALTAMAVAELGGHAVSLSGAQAGILTDGRYGNARLRDIEPRRIHQALAAGSIVLVTGFQGHSPGGDVTTLGRGGSDASAVALAAALGATECEIFTDVPAVFTADPRVVPDARPLRSIRHREMLEMTEAGAAVMQSRSIELAMAHGIDIHLRSSFTEAEGTWIRQERTRLVSTGALDGPSSGPGDVVGIAHRRHETLHTVIDVDLASVSVVSLGTARRPDIVVRAMHSLREAAIQPRLVATTPGRVSVLVDSALVDEAVRRLHATFIPGDTDAAIRAAA